MNVRGDAYTLKPNAAMNSIIEGDVLLFYYPTTGVHHAALATKVQDGYITIIETNYNRCKISTRTLHHTDPTIKGVYRPLSPTDSL